MTQKLRIALIDVIGLTYDANTIEKYGLGGSESATIRIAKSLNDIGFDVTVFNNCIDSRASEGVYGGVRYVDLSRLHTANDFTCDIMIGTRTVIPFLPDELATGFNYDPRVFKKLRESARLKVLLLHDTFCSGDHLLEQLTVSGHIDQIFTLSDFHTSYITNCQHGGPKRNFEVLKNKVFMTRNGATKYDVDITNKDMHQFVYNASITKGMLPLVLDIWPEVKRRIPKAKLTVIGGFYRFRDGTPPDAQEAAWHELVARDDLKNLDITFTGIITQKEIAGILAKSAFMIYPGAFPETFGISSLESLLYNTPIITTRFGALEETAIDAACYKIDYAIEPNNLFPEINKAEQVKKFVDTVLYAFNNPYLWTQKSNACRQVHDIASWDSVAKQWKQQFYKSLGHFLPVDEYREVQRINTSVQRVYGRRFTNSSEIGWTTYLPEKRIRIVSPVYNGEQYIRDCILSVAQQDYHNYEHIIIDDASTDRTYEVAKETINSLPLEVRFNFTVFRNKTNLGSVQNYFETFLGVEENAIGMMLDGDDHLANDPTIFKYYNELYHTRGVEFTYGSMWSKADKIGLYAQEYPDHVKMSKSYRTYLFPWNMPYTHLRTFTTDLFLRSVKKEILLDSTGNFLRAGGDTAFFYTMIEAADPTKIYAVPHIMYHYNDLSPINDYKVNSDEQTKTARAVLNTAPKENVKKAPTSTNTKKKILIAIPTAKYIEMQTFKSLWDLEVPDGYELDFTYSFGYNIAQVRNLIASWIQQGTYDYLFSVDSDIVLPKDTLTKMIAHDKDIISGVYIQRKPNVEIPEIYRWKGNHLTNVALHELKPSGLQKIDACGFGCVLIKAEVIQTMSYPHFVYEMDHKTPAPSEDVYFCMKATEQGFTLYADSTIVCGHIGNYNYTPKS